MSDKQGRMDALNAEVKELKLKVSAAYTQAAESYEAQIKLKKKLAVAVNAIEEVLEDCGADYPPSHAAIGHCCRYALKEIEEI